MDSIETLQRKVSEANRLLYNTASSDYESLDGRRDQALEAWLHRIVKEILSRHPQHHTLLDLACGSGFVLRALRSQFDLTYGIDIAEAMVRCASAFCDVCEVRDCLNTGYDDAAFSFVTCFAALHHFADLESLVREVYRLLKPGGVFYADHDMEHHFYARFKLPLSIYRRLCGGERHYTQLPGITDEIYRLSEYHANGINSTDMAAYLHALGFADVRISYHWYGLSRFTNRLFGTRCYAKGLAPLLRIVAIK